MDDLDKTVLLATIEIIRKHSSSSKNERENDANTLMSMNLSAIQRIRN